MSDWFSNRRRQELQGFFESIGGENSQMAQDFLQFEGNAQTIRIVSRLQVMADRYGLNLTVGTMSALLKYIAPSNMLHQKSGGWHERTKPGYFESENLLVRKINERTGTDERRNPITYLVEACDDIVYAIVDIEDGVKKSVVSWRQVWGELSNAVEGELIAGVRKHMDRILDGGDDPLTGVNREDFEPQAFRTAAISALVQSVLEAFVIRYEPIMKGWYHGELIADCSANSLVKACKGIAAKHVYTSRETLERELAGRTVIHDLMSYFWEAASAYNGEVPKTKVFAGKLYYLFSDNYRIVFEDRFGRGDCQNYARMQLVTDYICGMTDSFATTMHRKLRNV